MRKNIFVSILMIFTSSILYSQKLDPKYETVFIYQISKHIEWPGSINTFVIGVVGEANSPIIAELEQMTKIKKVDGKAIEIKQFGSASAINTNCHMVFVTNKQSAYIGDVVKQVANKNTLILTEKPGLAKKGSSINFINVSGKLRFELNKGSCSIAGLKVASYLEGLAIVVD